MSALGPAVPQNWYLLGKAQSLQPGQVVSHEIFDQDLIIYRGRETGQAVAMAAHCAHMGCHLGSADVIGDQLRCALHYRRIEADGRFGGGGHKPLRQLTFPVSEHLGGLFVYLGTEEHCADLSTLGLDGQAVCYAGEHHFALPWQSLVANGLDIEHLGAVHDRNLMEQPTLEVQASRELRVRYRTKPSSPKFSDRILARLARGGVRGSIRTLGGSMMLVESRTDRRATFILMSFVPDNMGGTTIRGLVGIKGAPTLMNRLSARVARALFKSFLFKDLAVLERLKWHEPPQVDGLGDDYMQQVCAFFRSLESA